MTDLEIREVRGGLLFHANRGDHHAQIVVPSRVVDAGGGWAVAQAVEILDAQLDDLEAKS